MALVDANYYDSLYQEIIQICEKVSKIDINVYNLEWSEKEHMIRFWTSDWDIKEKILNKLASSERVLKILDLGGGKNSWLGEYVTDIIDLYPDYSNPKVNYIKGDFYDVTIWDNIPDEYFDFVNCSHVLEDIRDPKFIVNMMSKKSKAGLIIVPNKYDEIKFIESKTWLGYYHHRWIFNILENNLFAFAKYHYINPIVQNAFLNFLIKILIVLIYKRKIYSFPQKLKKGKLSSDLQLIWIDSIDLIYYNDDYPGHTAISSAELMDGFIQTKSEGNDINTIDEVLSNIF